MGIKVKARQTKLSVGPSKGGVSFHHAGRNLQHAEAGKSHIRSLHPLGNPEGKPSGCLGKPLVRLSRHGPPRDIPLPCPEWVPCASACKPRLSPKWKM